VNALKNEIVFLPDYAIEEVSKYFSIPKEEMLCFLYGNSRGWDTGFNYFASVLSIYAANKSLNDFTSSAK